MTFAIAGLLANVLHGLGHVVSGSLAGSPMDELLFTATRDANIYRGDQSGVRGRIHVVRALGGPLANLAAAAALFAIGSVAGDAGQPYLTRSVGVNLAFGLGSLLPLPSLDGQILWRELRRRWR